MRKHLESKHFLSTNLKIEVYDEKEHAQNSDFSYFSRFASEFRNNCLCQPV